LHALTRLTQLKEIIARQL